MKKAGENAKSEKLKKDDPEQSQRFVETAKELEANLSENKFETAIASIKIKPPANNNK